MVWERAVEAPLSLSMTPEEERERQIQLAEQRLRAQAAGQARLTEQGLAEEAAIREESRRQEELALSPEEAAYRRLHGGSPSPDYVPEPALLDPNVPYVAPVPAGAPTAPAAPVDPTVPAGGPPEEPKGRDYDADISKVMGRYMGADGRFQEAEGAWDTRRGEIAEQYRTGKEARVTQAQQELDKAKSVLGTATEKLSNWEINPQRAFPNAFSKITAVISVAMGAYAQGLSGGKLPNTALGIIDNAIKTDIDAQKMEYQKLKGLVDEKRNVYGMAMRLLGSAEQAEQVAYTAAYQTYQAEINKIGKEYGLEYGAINLSSKIDQGNRKLEVNAAKAAGSGGKLPVDMRKSMTAFSSLKDKLKRMWSLSKDINMARGYLDVFVPGETDTKEFDRLGEQAAADMVYAISGVTARQEEYDRARKWAPKSTDFEGMRVAKMVGIMEYSLEKGTEHYHTLTSGQRARLSPQLRAMYEMSPEQRRGTILTLLEGQGHNIQAKGWEAEVGGIKSSMKSDGWLAGPPGSETESWMGGERVTGKK